MNAIVISTDSPEFECQSPACYIDAESIDTSFVYDSEYASSCNVNDSITVIGGGEDGTDGSDGSDGRGIVSILRTAGDGSAGTTDTYTITYTIAPLTSTFDVVNGADGAIGATGDTGLTGDTGATGAAGTDGTDGSQILYGTADPTIANPGVNGDYYLRTNTFDLYYKSGGTWSILVNIKGDTGAAGSDGTDGEDGDIWSYGAVIPTSTTVNTFNEYYLYTVNNDVYYKAEGATTWSLITNINGNVYKTTSTTSVILTTLAVGDAQSLTVDSSLAYTIGQFVVVANSTTNQFTGKVTAYSGITLDLEVTYVTGTGTLASWDINLAGVVESGSVPQWYTITATAGTGTITSRTFTAPNGWTVDAASVVSVPDLPLTSANDLNIQHSTGLYAVDTVVFVDDGTYNTKATGTAAYGTMYEDDDHTTIQLSSFCQQAKALIIHVKLQ